MKFVLQRVKSASVTVDEKMIGHIEKGLLVFIGVGETDTKEVADKMLNKLLKLRVFQDDHDKTNLSIHDVSGELMMISQFTLYADCKKGNRPSFTGAGNPELAEELYEYMIEQAKKSINTVETGEFGADMKIELVNDGPFTIVLDSSEM